MRRRHVTRVFVGIWTLGSRPAAAILEGHARPKTAAGDARDLVLGAFWRRSPAEDLARVAAGGGGRDARRLGWTRRADAGDLNQLATFTRRTARNARRGAVGASCSAERSARRRLAARVRARSLAGGLLASLCAFGPGGRLRLEIIACAARDGDHARCKRHDQPDSSHRDIEPCFSPAVIDGGPARPLSGDVG